MMSTSDLVVHVPHASLSIPENVWPQFLRGREDIASEAHASADLFTDVMAQQAWPDATIVAAEVSRLVVDVERYDDDAVEDMAAVGRGVIYTHDHRQVRMRKTLLLAERLDLLKQYYTPHWTRLRAAAAGKVLIDLHSYPKEPWPIERQIDGARPEIDIGFSAGLAPESWIDALTEHFRQVGFTVGHNTPYSGVIDAGAKAAVMIEILRDIVGVPGDNAKWRKLIVALKAMPLPKFKDIAA